MITISLCMIVKNEEEILERCLESLAGIADEIIIVDTGSTDKTKKIASNFTKKVYDFAWTGSFADARNFSFSKATMEYIYTADADEYLDEKNRSRFLFLKKGLLPEIEIVQMLYANQLSHNTIYNFDKEYRPKLYKRVRGFVWEGVIHEMVRLEPIVYDSDIEITHMPTANHSARDIKAFESLYKDGVRISKRLHNIYAKELFIAGTDQNFIDALPMFLESFEDIERSQDEIQEAACVIACAYRILNKRTSFFKYALKGVSTNPCSEMCYELGRFYEKNQDYNEAIMWYYNAAYETKCILNIHLEGDLPLYAIAKCYEKLGNSEESAKYLELAQNWTLPESPDAKSQS